MSSHIQRLSFSWLIPSTLHSLNRHYVKLLLINEGWSNLETTASDDGDVEVLGRKFESSVNMSMSLRLLFRSQNNQPILYDCSKRRRVCSKISYVISVIQSSWMYYLHGSNPQMIFIIIIIILLRFLRSLAFHQFNSNRFWLENWGGRS